MSPREKRMQYLSGVKFLRDLENIAAAALYSVVMFIAMIAYVYHEKS